MRALVRLAAVLAFALAFLPAARAHIGSKDVFETVHAGPYTLFVTVRPPNVIPGVATVEVRSSGAAITGLRITPLPVTGEASKHPPASDAMSASVADGTLFTGAVWIMASGTWQVRFDIDGAAGAATASVPVLAVPVAVLKMDRRMGLTLSVFGLFLLLSMAGIVAAAVGESRLRPGVFPGPGMRRRALIGMAVGILVMAGMVLLGGKWWNVEAADYAGAIFTTAPTVATLHGDQLDLTVKRLGVETDRRIRLNTDYLPDHGKLMHLYAIREPGMDAAFHLHPTLVSAGDFRMTLPAMPPGHYNLYGDVVHATGLPETLVASVDVPPTMQGGALALDDASAKASPLCSTPLGPAYVLPDGYRMVWDEPAAITAGTAYTFHFRLLDPNGKPAAEMQPYLGMAGHAAFVKTDGTVFAHTHPEGSAAMADVMLANDSIGAKGDMAAMPPVTAEVGFPYGFPTPGRYRIFVQMKHEATVETGVFDADVK